MGAHRLPLPARFWAILRPMKPALLAVLAVLALPLWCPAQSTLTFPRVMQAGDFNSSSFAIVNPGPNDAAVTFSLYGEKGGSALQVSTQTIKSGGQLAKLG